MDAIAWDEPLFKTVARCIYPIMDANTENMQRTLPSLMNVLGVTTDYKYPGLIIDSG